MERAVGSRYVLGERLGAGGMGEVYRAARRDGGPERAIKLLRPELAEDPILLARFVQERNVMLRLRSPHLVAVEDLIVDGEHLAIVMELVPGPSLRQLLEQRGPLPASEALLIVQQVLIGLSVVHAHGVVHRDVKPENVLLVGDPSDESFQAKVTDFGIARLIGGPALTEEASLLGTPHYTAPELAEAQTPTPAVDVYAAGVVLYELLSGRTPFAGLPPVAVIKRQLEQEPPRPAHMADSVWHLLAHWLHRDPAQRPADAQAALNELGGVVLRVAGHGHQPLPAPVGAPATSGTGPSGLGDSVPAAGLQVIHAAGDQPGTRELVGPPTQLRDSRAPFAAGAPPHPGGPPAGSPPPGGHAAQPVHQPRRRRGLTGLSKRIQVAAVAGIVVLAGVSTGMVLTSGSEPARQVTFPTENYPDSEVNVDRTWVLKLGDKPVLEGTLTIHRGRKAVTIDEVLPKGLDGHIDSDADQSTTDNAHILHYDVQPGKGEVEVVKYQVEIAKQVATQAAVQAYAVQQITATGDIYRSTHKLTRVEFKPNDYTVAPGGVDQVKLRAWSGGELAPTIATYGAAFTLAARDLVTIGPNGAFQGNRSGETRVTAKLTQDGTQLTSSGTITVLEAQVGKPDAGSALSNDPDEGLAGLPAPAETKSGTDPATRPSSGKAPSAKPSSAPGADPGTSPAPVGEGSAPPPAVPTPGGSGSPSTDPESTAPESTPTAEPTTPEPTDTTTEPAPGPTDSPVPDPTTTDPTVPDTPDPGTTEPGPTTPPDGTDTTSPVGPDPVVTDAPTTDPSVGGDIGTTGTDGLPVTTPDPVTVTTETPTGP